MNKLIKEIIEREMPSWKLDEGPQGASGINDIAEPDFIAREIPAEQGSATQALENSENNSSQILIITPVETNENPIKRTIVIVNGKIMGIQG